MSRMGIMNPLLMPGLRRQSLLPNLAPTIAAMRGRNLAGVGETITGVGARAAANRVAAMQTQARLAEMARRRQSEEMQLLTRMLMGQLGAQQQRGWETGEAELDRTMRRDIAATQAEAQVEAAGARGGEQFLSDEDAFILEDVLANASSTEQRIGKLLEWGTSGEVEKSVAALEQRRDAELRSIYPYVSEKAQKLLRARYPQIEFEPKPVKPLGRTRVIRLPDGTLRRRAKNGTTWLRRPGEIWQRQQAAPEVEDQGNGGTLYSPAGILGSLLGQGLDRAGLSPSVPLTQEPAAAPVPRMVPSTATTQPTSRPTLAEPRTGAKERWLLDPTGLAFVWDDLAQRWTRSTRITRKQLEFLRAHVNEKGIYVGSLP